MYWGKFSELKKKFFKENFLNWKSEAFGMKYLKFLKFSFRVGFKKVTTIDNLVKWFPHLDCTDFSRKAVDPRETEMARKKFKQIEAIVMLGEPLKWETSLQLMLDCVLTNGSEWRGPLGTGSRESQWFVTANSLFRNTV